IYGKLGLPAMGVQGAALATVCAAAGNAGVILLLARAQGYPYIFQIRRHFRWNRAIVGEYFRKCFPIICNEVLIGVGNMVINMVLGRQAEEAIAAVAVFRTLEGFVIGFFAGCSNAASVLVGKSVGAGELDDAYERAKRLVPLCAGVILVVIGLILAVHKPLLTAMSLTGESYRLGVGLLCIYGVMGAIRMCNWTMNDTYRSAGDATMGTVLEITFMYLMVLPCVTVSGLVLHAPFLVIFACCFVDEPVRFILMQRHMYSGRWVKPVTPAGKAALPAFRDKHGRKKRAFVVAD
ncbi:MAG: MATE family efflux transporter, partial [Candidatus Spyradocola sp.]